MYSAAYRKYRENAERKPHCQNGNNSSCDPGVRACLFHLLPLAARRLSFADTTENNREHQRQERTDQQQRDPAKVWQNSNDPDGKFCEGCINCSAIKTKNIGCKRHKHVVENDRQDILADIGEDNNTENLKHGALVGVYKHIGENLKIGVGYNFSNFQDDLRDTDINAQGWFINIIGKF